MRTNLWKRAAALLVSGTLAVSMFAMSASARSFEQWQQQQQEFQPFRDELLQVPEYDYWDSKVSASARYDGLTTLIQKYPSYADAYYERASFAESHFADLSAASKVTLAEVIQDANTAITLAEQNPDGYYRNGGEWNEGSIFLANAYALRAEIALNLQYQQQEYLDFMQKAVDLREQYYIDFFKTANSNWSSMGEEMCQNARAKKQLEEIRAWSASGAKDFQTLDGHVQVTGGAGNKIITIVETLSDGSTVTQTMNSSKQPVRQVLRGVDQIILVLPSQFIAEMHYVRQDASGAVVEDKTMSPSSFSQDVGTLQDFPSAIPAEMPQKVRDFLEKDGTLAGETVRYAFYQKNA